jgi:hypothetical protein
MQSPVAVKEKIENEIQNGRIADPFSKRPIWNLICSPVGIVPKTTSSYRLITHLSYPPSNSVDDFTDKKFSTVQYSSFDKALSIVKKLDKNALIAKMDIKSAFRLLTVYPGDFNLLGFKIDSDYFIDKCMPMGCSISCSTFENISTCLHWLKTKESNSENLYHYLDDFFFTGKANSNDCQSLLTTFINICNKLQVLIADEKTAEKIADKKMKELLVLIREVAFSKKVTLKTLQSLCGVLAFCTMAIPAVRAFSRRLYMATSKAKKPFHLIRITKEIFNDLMIWKMLVENFIGKSFILDDTWLSNFDMQLFTDSAGGIGQGYGCYLFGKWSMLQWPVEWYHTDMLKDITFLEMIPIALSVFFWDRVFKRKKISFHVDNLAVATVLNSKSSKYPRVMNLLRFIVYRSMMGHFHMKAFHISSANNCVADALSRGQFQKFKELAPEDTFPTAVPMALWSLLNSTLSI